MKGVELVAKKLATNGKVRLLIQMSNIYLTFVRIFCLSYFLVLYLQETRSYHASLTCLKVRIRQACNR